MSWAKLLADKRITRVPPSKAELDNLRSIVTRSLKDVTAAGLSAEEIRRLGAIHQFRHEGGIKNGIYCVGKFCARSEGSNILERTR